MTLKDLADSLGLNYNTVRRWVGEYKRFRFDATDEEVEHHVTTRSRLAEDAARMTPVDKVRNWVASKAKFPDAKPFGKRVKVVVAGDIHGHPDWELIEKIHQEKPDLVVLAGDLLDSAAINPHGKPDVFVGLQQEIQNVRGAIEYLLTNDNTVVQAIRGNHDDWAGRQLEKIDPELKVLFRDPLEVIFDGLGNRAGLVYTAVNFKAPFRHTAHNLGILKYMIIVGDVAISHHNFTGSKPGDAVFKFRQKFAEWRHTLGGADPKVYIQAHVHNVSYVELDGGHVVLVEPGMLGQASTEAYKLGHKMVWRPGVSGAFVFEMENEEYVHRSGRFI